MATGQQDGAQGYKVGNLRRELDTVNIAAITSALNVGSGTKTISLQLTNLSAQLKLSIGGGFDSGSNKKVALPAGAATIQITPINKFKDSNKVYGREVFQDPTATDNANHPLPQDLPFTWEGDFTLATSAQIDITFNLALWAGFSFNGAIVVQVAVEFDGHWWDVQTIEYVMSQVQLQQKDPITIGTGGS